MYRAKTAAGMTMIEALIASAIFAMVISMCFGILHWSSQSFAEQIREATLTDKGEKIMKAVMEDLADATQITTPQPVTCFGYTFADAEVRFKVPLRFKNMQINTQTGQPVNAKGYAVTIWPVPVTVDPATGLIVNAPTFSDDFDFRLVYGWRDTARWVPNLDDNSKPVPLQGPGLQTNSSYLPAGVTLTSGRTPDGRICFRFQMNRNKKAGKYGKDGLISEYEEGIDLDGDGQKSSTYALGYLERSYWIEGASQPVAGSRQAIGDSCIVQPTVQLTGDSTQLKTSRIFRSADTNQTRVEVCVWVLTMDTSGELHMMRCTTTDFLRNNAQYVTATSATGTN